MAQIALNPAQSRKSKKTPPIETLTNAAWQFAYAALWQEEHFYPKEVERVKQEISTYFLSSTDLQKAFIAFCERIILANQYFVDETPKYLPHPSIWFNKHFQYGFPETLSWYNKLQQKRAEIPDYREYIYILAKSYWQYTNKPYGKAFIKCRKKLLQLKEYGLIRLFYTSIIYSQLLNPSK